MLLSVAQTNTFFCLKFVFPLRRVLFNSWGFFFKGQSHQLEFDYEWYVGKSKKRRRTMIFLVHLRFFNPSKHECIVSMKMYLKYLILAETGLGNMPSSSPCFLSTESFFSRIFPLHTANEKIWRQERIWDQLDPLLFWAFPKCIHNSVNIAY